MHRSHIFFLLILGLSITLVTSCNKSQKDTSTDVDLPAEWYFLPGDDMSRAETETSTEGWLTQKAGVLWDEQGFDTLDGYAWYRVNFTLPSYIKENSFFKDSVKFYLGKIDDYDEVFLNGKPLGYNCKTVKEGEIFPDSFVKGFNPWYKKRLYIISVNDKRLLWDKENVLAVRVYDGGVYGGIYDDMPVIGMMDVKDYLKANYKYMSFDFQNDIAVKEFDLKNTNKSAGMDGELTVSAVNDMTGEEFYKKTSHIRIDAGGKTKIKVEIPAQKESTTVTYSFLQKGALNPAVFRDELPYILTPPPAALPQINSPAVTGVRPGNPFLFKIPVTGEKPLKIAVEGLPEGLVFDAASGIIRGKTSKKGEYKISLTAENSKGKDSTIMKIVVGDMIALTPPMGWNSWNCWGISVDDDKVIASARAFVEKGLADHGWTYINIDDGWEIKGSSQEPKRESDGTIRTNEKFPDMKALGDTIHSLGLKFGIYSSPGPLTCGGYTASYEHEYQDAATFAGWGVDYLKYDWCSYGKIAKDNSLPELKKPYFLMRDALDSVNRDIVYSLCQYGMGKVWEWGAEVGGNLWRTTGDITDTWKSLKSIGFSQTDNAEYAGPGHWNDPDMLVVGRLGWGTHLHPSRLTANEQYTHISLWALLSAPLLIGCDLQSLDDFTLNLLTNDEVISVDQDVLGKQATPVFIDGDIQIWVKQLADGTKAVGIFNLGDKVVDYKFVFEKAGLQTKLSIRDLWRQTDLGTFEGSKIFKMPVHGVYLLKVK
jgi:hypothetical protein